jgi:ferric-dicitrate binding protein FerR (iron transport regulator)
MSEFTHDLIIKYLENTLPEDDEQVLLDWIKASETNLEFFLTCKKIHALGKIRNYSEPLLISKALQTFNQRTKSFQKRQKRKVLVRFSKYAAILFFTLAIPALIWFAIHEKPIQLTTVTVDRVEPVKMILLPDGSKVWINNESSFTYPISFSQRNRKVTLDGEAFFEVKTDSLRPFIVTVNDMQVKVFGTSFNVNTNTSDSTILTTLVTGHVAISDLEGNNLTMLSPGQLASFHQRDKRIGLRQVNTDLYTSWRKGLLVFDKASLTEITDKIETVYNVNITINTQNQVQNKINFVFRKSQSIDTVMEMLKFVAPISYKKYDDQVYINLK